MKRIICFQIGVDVLGFPIYMQHIIHQDKPNKHKQTLKANRWLVVFESLIKQH